jgi:hypothetical protein
MSEFASKMYTPDSVELTDTKEHTNDPEFLDSIGVGVIGRKRWDGEVPEGSFMFINPYMRMSTPEFYFFRKCQELSHEDAIELACTLMSHYNTHMTRPRFKEGDIERKDCTHTTCDKLWDYLLRINPCVERKRALDVLYDAMPYLDGYEAACEKFCK